MHLKKKKMIKKINNKDKGIETKKKVLTKCGELLHSFITCHQNLLLIFQKWSSSKTQESC